MPIHIQSLNSASIHVLTYLHAGPHGAVITAQLPIFIGRVIGLPPGIDALVWTSDLQGIEPQRSAKVPPWLVGELLADELAVLAALGDIPPLDRTGVVLAGDLYAAPQADQLGVSGDVRSVWDAFRHHFRWVVGVAGNHDQFGTTAEFAMFRQQERLYYLDGTHCTLDELTVAGIGGIIGKTTKPFRRAAEQYADVLKQVLQSKPDVLVIHESPALPERRERGSLFIRELMDRFACPLTVCGHSQWKECFAELPNGTTLLNVDSRVVVLVRDTT